MKGRAIYVPPELLAEVERIQRQLGISKSDAIRLILKGKRDTKSNGFVV